ncbi:ABC transporter ATP-binding protein [Microvirga massiliensis]|uniref:ABC transporter ATP-binding protein n=1 Tax=Microvirga massiliensis TaxID=1033741 RepID=UPI00062B52F1|nr:sn-glycerol-3-phosphate ABC transporter ATP-binding protein UgpC [Microvirga massiliensis]
MAEVTIRGLEKRYGAYQALRDIDLSIRDGELAVLVGPSGCGKSTLLRTIAGLEDISGGTIAIGGEVVNNVRPRDRDVAMVFQDYALYPHMSVSRNIGFGLRARKLPKHIIKAKVLSAAATLGIEPLLDRYPRQLSGGQRQRVAIGRAIVRDPQIFLFDEPLSNLDAQLRDEMRSEIKRLHQELGVTMIYVTHDQIEAMTLADRIVVLKDGQIEQQGSPLDLYERPQTRFVAGFIGSPQMNFVPVELAEDGSELRLGDRSVLAADFRRLASPAPRRLTLGFRPSHVAPARSEDARKGHVRRVVRIDLVQPTGARSFVTFQLGNSPVTAEVGAHEAGQVGEDMAVDIDLSRAVLIDDATGRVL